MTFDQALPALARLALELLGSDTLSSALVLRDAQGALTLVIRTDVLASDRAAFDEAARMELGSYASEPSATPDELYDDALRSDAEAIDEVVHVDADRSIFVKLLDRQIIGQDWTRPNFNRAANVPLLTFFSCKGGVGRSTALAVAAADLSAKGKNVLIVDFDLEAPGIGSILLNNQDLPDYGLLDYLIEARMDGADDSFLEACIAPSPLTSGRGLIEIMPALGKTGSVNPWDVLPKLGRAYLDASGGDGKAISYLEQMRSLMGRLSNRGRSDVIFVDARAGLSESTAPAVVGLGGEILLFGVDTPQTLECYSYLLAHLSRFAPIPDQADDWRSRLRMVHAKAGRTEEAWLPYREKSYDLFSSLLYEQDESSAVKAAAFNFDIDDPVAPHFPWPIPFDGEFAEFDPRKRGVTLQRDFYDRTFGPFNERLFDLLFPEERLADD